MLSRLLLFSLIMLASCKGPNDQKIMEVIAQPETPYQRFVNTLAGNKASFREKYKGVDTLSAAQMAEITDYWVKMISDSFYYYWKGTPYIVYGKPKEPGLGPICSERLLAHIYSEIGLSVDYEKISHSSTNEVQAEFSNWRDIDDQTKLSQQAFDHYITKKGKGVYLIALGIQGGLIINDGIANYLLYTNMGYGVVKERLDTTWAVKTAIYKKIICLTSNKMLMKGKWLGL